MAVRDDLVIDGRIERAMHVVQQQRARIAVAEPTDGQLREPGEDIVADAGARSADDCDPLGEEPSGDEAQDLGRGLVEPLRVVDDADERLLVGDQGEQCQRPESHQEPVGRRPGAQSEHRRQRVALRDGQPVEEIQHGCAELVEAGIGQLHLRLDARGPGDMPAGDSVGHVAQQGALAHAGLPAQDGGAAVTGERVGQEPVERLAFGPPSEELHRRPPCLRKTPPCLRKTLRQRSY